MTAANLLTVCGIFHIGFIIFHIRFRQIFNWDNDLQSISYVNRQIMPILNWCLTFLFIAFTYLMLFESNELLRTSIGRFLLYVITGFWAFRLVLQFVYFGWKSKRSNQFALLLFVGNVLLISIIFLNQQAY